MRDDGGRVLRGLPGVLGRLEEERGEAPVAVRQPPGVSLTDEEAAAPLAIFCKLLQNKLKSKY